MKISVIKLKESLEKVPDELVSSIGIEELVKVIKNITNFNKSGIIYPNVLACYLGIEKKEAEQLLIYLTFSASVAYPVSVPKVDGELYPEYLVRGVLGDMDLEDMVVKTYPDSELHCGYDLYSSVVGWQINESHRV